MKRRTPLQRGGKLRPVSAKRVKINRIYSALRKTFLTQHPYCQWFIREARLNEAEVIQSQGRYTTDKGTFQVPLACDVHHMKGRGPYLLDTSTWMAVSRDGHDYIHAHPKESYDKGYMLPR